MAIKSIHAWSSALDGVKVKLADILAEVVVKGIRPPVALAKLEVLDVPMEDIE